MRERASSEAAARFCAHAQNWKPAEAWHLASCRAEIVSTRQPTLTRYRRKQQTLLQNDPANRSTYEANLEAAQRTFQKHQHGVE